MELKFNVTRQSQETFIIDPLPITPFWLVTNSKLLF